MFIPFTSYLNALSYAQKYGRLPKHSMSSHQKQGTLKWCPSTVHKCVRSWEPSTNEWMKYEDLFGRLHRKTRTRQKIVNPKCELDSLNELCGSHKEIQSGRIFTLIQGNLSWVDAIGFITQLSFLNLRLTACYQFSPTPWISQDGSRITLLVQIILNL
jgi:hypothetical protein